MSTQPALRRTLTNDSIASSTTSASSRRLSLKGLLRSIGRPGSKWRASESNTQQVVPGSASRPQMARQRSQPQRESKESEPRRPTSYLDTVNFKLDREGGAQMWIGFFPLKPGSAYMCGAVRADDFHDLDSGAMKAASYEQTVWERTLAEENTAYCNGVSEEEKALSVKMEETESRESNEEDVRRHAWLRVHTTADQAADRFNKRREGLKVRVMPPDWSESCYKSVRRIDPRTPLAIDLGDHPERRLPQIREELLDKYVRKDRGGRSSSYRT